MNSKRTVAAASRREFLRGGVRYALAAGLATASVALLRRRSNRLPRQICINEGICPGCTVFADCALPQALSAKAASQRGGA